MSDRWQESGVPRGVDYDRRFEDLAAAGMDMHGEAALVASYAPDSVLDAGCGTGRVAIELSRRGYAVMGVDVDESMLEAARAKAPELTWTSGDLANPELDFGLTFDVVVMAGNVLIFVLPGTEGQVMDNAARWLRPGGRLVSGYSLRTLAGVDAFGPPNTTCWRPARGSFSRIAGRRGTSTPSRRPTTTPSPCTGGRSEPAPDPPRNGAATLRPSDALNVQDNPISLGFWHGN